jgi:hypothetical protein
MHTTCILLFSYIKDVKKACNANSNFPLLDCVAVIFETKFYEPIFLMNYSAWYNGRLAGVLRA